LPGASRKTNFGLKGQDFTKDRGAKTAFNRNYADDEMLEPIISLPNFLRRDLPERWIKSPISESP
jgi:hypothetical protein